MTKTKYVGVNYYNSPFMKYVPVKERSDGGIIKTAFGGLVGIVTFMTVIWALSYMTCVAQYKSSVCKQDMASQLIFKLIK